MRECADRKPLCLSEIRLADWHWREGTNSDASGSRLELEPNNDSAVKGNGIWRVGADGLCNNELNDSTIE